MAARQLCWPTAILFYRCSLDLLFSLPNLRGHFFSPNFARFSILTQISKFCGPFPPKLGGPKTSKFRRDFAQPRLANMFETQQDIVNRKTTLQTTDTPAQHPKIVMLRSRWLRRFDVASGRSFLSPLYFLVWVDAPDRA